MIKTFKCKDTEGLFYARVANKIPRAIQRVAMRKLLILNEVEKLSELRVPPANHLEKILGDRENSYSIRINDKWRICFEWKNGYKYNVEIVNYH